MCKSCKVIPCRADTLGVLVPDTTNPVTKVYLEQHRDEEGMTGRLLIGDRVIAFLHYDCFDKIITGYTCTDLSPTAAVTETSIRNILNSL